MEWELPEKMPWGINFLPNLNTFITADLSFLQEPLELIKKLIKMGPNTEQCLVYIKPRYNNFSEVFLW